MSLIAEFKAIEDSQYANLIPSFTSLGATNNGVVDVIPPPSSWINNALETINQGLDTYKNIVSTLPPVIYNKAAGVVIPDNAIVQKKVSNVAAATGQQAAVVSNNMLSYIMIGFIIVGAFIFIKK